MSPSPDSDIRIAETGPQAFSLTVAFGGQTFECGSYISRAAAQQAGRMFLQRKEREGVGQQRRPRRKTKP